MYKRQVQYLAVASDGDDAGRFCARRNVAGGRSSADAVSSLPLGHAGVGRSGDSAGGAAADVVQSLYLIHI